jgi:hypothetical protein
MTTTACLDPRMGALLHAYELRGLSESDTVAFETHLLTCDCCFAAVQSFEPYAELLSTDEAIQGEFRGSPGDDASLSLGRRLGQALWPDHVTPLLRPAILMVVILLLAYPAWRGLNEDPGVFVRATQKITLMPTRSGAVDSFTASRAQDGIILFGCPGARPNQSCHIVITALDDARMKYDVTIVLDADAVGHILFPARLMRPGAYQLEIDDHNAAASGENQVYRFMVHP